MWVFLGNLIWLYQLQIVTDPSFKIFPQKRKKNLNELAAAQLESRVLFLKGSEEQKNTLKPSQNPLKQNS